MTNDEIKAIRTAKGWTQAELAKHVGFSIHAVQSWEQGRNPVPQSVEKLLSMERELKIPIDLILEISNVAREAGVSFEEALFSAIKEGLGVFPRSAKPGNREG